MLKKRITLIAKFAISAGIILYLLRAIPFARILMPLTTAKQSYILVSLLIAAVAIYLSSIQLYLLTRIQGLPFSKHQILKVNLITRFYSLFLPGYLSGGAVRWYKLTSASGEPTKSLTSVAFNRLFITITTAMVGFLFWTLDSKARSNLFIGATLLGLPAILLSIYFIATNSRLYIASRRLIQRFAIVPGKIKILLLKLFESVYTFRDLSSIKLLGIIGIAVTAFAIELVHFFLFAGSVGIDIPVVSLGWIRSGLLLILLLPISFSGIGVREGSLIVLLKSYGVPAENAIALSLLLLGSNVFFGLIGGIIEGISVFKTR